MWSTLSKYYQDFILIVSYYSCELHSWLRPGFSEKEIPSFPLNFHHTRKIATKKVTKTPILPNCQVSNGFFSITVNYIIQELKFCKMAQLFFCLSFSRATKIWRNERIFLSENPGHNCQSSLDSFFLCKCSLIEK